MSSYHIVVLNRVFSTLCLVFYVNPSASKMMDLCFPPAVNLTRESASFQNCTETSKSLKWENAIENTGICSCHNRQDTAPANCCKQLCPQGQPLPPFSLRDSFSATLSHETDTEQSPRQSCGFIYASSHPGQLQLNYFRFTRDLNLAPRAREPTLPSQESANLSLTFLGRKGHAALSQSSDRGIGAVNPPRISLDATE